MLFSSDRTRAEIAYQRAPALSNKRDLRFPHVVHPLSLRIINIASKGLSVVHSTDNRHIDAWFGNCLTEIERRAMHLVEVASRPQWPKFVSWYVETMPMNSLSGCRFTSKLNDPIGLSALIVTFRAKLFQLPSRSTHVIRKEVQLRTQVMPSVQVERALSPPFEASRKLCFSNKRFRLVENAI